MLCFLTLLVSFTLFAGQQKGHSSSWCGLPHRRGRSSSRIRAGSKAGVLACWIRGNKHLTIGAPASQVRFVRFLRAGFTCTVGLLKSS